MTVNAASRFQIVDVAVRNPGASIISKNPTGPFIDPGVDFGLNDTPPFRGRLYFTKDEVREMAEQFGLFEEADQRTAEAVEGFDSAERRGFEAGYAAGRAENLDHLADELVDRMRDRVGKPRSKPAAAASDVEGDPLPVPAAGEGADASVGEEPVGVSDDRSADGDA